MTPNVENEVFNNKKMKNIFPITCNSLYKLYRQAIGSFWIPEEIDLSNDKNDWDNKLNDDERYLFSNVLSFFSQSDKIVNINLEERFSSDIESLPLDLYKETELFYNSQKTIEDIHSQMYELLLNTYIKDTVELEKLTNGLKNIPAIKKKGMWAKKWIDDKEASFATRLVAFAALEGIFFSGSFCTIFWIKERNILKGLIHSNKFISRDEGLHRDFACELFNLLRNHPEYKIECSDEQVVSIIKEAVELEKEFITESFNCRLIGMNGQLMCEYIEYVADHLLGTLNIEPYFKNKNPFLFMESISLEVKANFFEERVTEYKKHGSNKKTVQENTHILNDDF